MMGYEAMAAALVAEGTEVIFGVLGGDNDNLVHRLVEMGVRYVPVRHEQGAVGMADGYSRATGRPGIATVTLGPGLTNAATPMTAAQLSGSQVLVLVGDKRPGDGYDDRFGNMMIEHHPLLAATIKNYLQLASVGNLGRDIQECFRQLRLGAGPVALNTPWPVLDASQVPDDWAYVPSAQTLPHPSPTQPDGHALKRAADLLAESERPVLIGGTGALGPGAADAIAGLAARAGALLAATLPARGLFAGEPFYVGVSGGFALGAARDILGQADLVIGFGASLNSHTLGGGRLYTGARVIRVEHDMRRAAAPGYRDDLVVHGDARLTADALAQALPAQANPRWRTDEVRRAIEQIDGWRGVEFTEHPDCLDPRLVTKIANEVLPAERLVVIDIGQFMAVPAMHMDVSAAGDLVLPWRLGAIGQGLPAAVGAALGRPDRLTVLFVGDGGIMTTIAELETAARCGIPLLVLVIDDGGYGAERYANVTAGRPSDLVDFENPDFAGIATAMGLRAFSARSAQELRDILADIAPLDRPALVRVIVDRDVYSTALFRLQANFRGREG
ncbi:MAG TPA: thiamine pyrophosphate-binding protein [Streptosporangiaceae bacterium]|nr:thiamine pyrophosphate-binding protein [Streptosporangiaceae bacterium]